MSDYPVKRKNPAHSGGMTMHLGSQGEGSSRFQLLEFCEPIFYEVCHLNRSSRQPEAVDPTLNANSQFSYARVRAKFVALFEDLKTEAQTDPALQRAFEKVLPPLAFFVDDFIVHSRLPKSFITQWSEAPLMAVFANTGNGAVLFYQQLDILLASKKTAETVEQLAVFHTCLTLGFRGQYADDKSGNAQIEDRIAKLNTSLEGWIASDPEGKITPQAYDPDTTKLWERPSAWLPIVAGVFVVALIGVVVAHITLYRSQETKLRTILNQVVEGK